MVAQMVEQMVQMLAVLKAVPTVALKVVSSAL